MDKCIKSPNEWHENLVDFFKDWEDKIDTIDTLTNLIEKFIKRINPDAYGDFPFALRRIEEDWLSRGERIKQLEELEVVLDDFLASSPVYIVTYDGPYCVYCDAPIGYQQDHKPNCIWIKLKTTYEALSKEE